MTNFARGSCRIAVACAGCFIAVNAAAASERPNAWTTIPVVVAAPAGVSDALLRRVFDEADAIWQPAGIVFDWRRAADGEPASSGQLALTVDDIRGRSVESEAALGWIGFASGAPDHVIHVSETSAEALIHRTPTALDTTTGAHEQLVGRALGRAFSHEFGHYVLKSTEHTRHGLMRAKWPSEEFLSLDRRGFQLDAQERDSASRIVAAKPAHCAS